MDDLGILARDFGIRPQGKSAPMAASKSSSAVGSSRSASVVTTWNKPRSGPRWTSTSPGDPLFAGGGPGGDPGGDLSGDRIPTSYGDVFSGPPRKSSPPSIDSIFDGYNKDPAPKSSSMPVFDKPVYDDDIFDGVPGMKSSASVEYDDVFASIGSAPERVSSPPYDDLLDSLGKGMPEKNESGERRSGESKEKEATGFEDLLPGFGGSSQPQKRQVLKEDHQEPAKPTTSASEEPFVVLEAAVNKSSGTYDYPLDQFGRSMSSGSTNINLPPVGGFVFDDFDGLGQSAPSFPSNINENSREDHYKVNQNTSPVYNFSEKPPQRSSLDTFENFTSKSQPTRTSETQNSVGRHSSQSSSPNSNAYDQNLTSDQSPKSHQHAEAADGVWLTVSEIPLFTKPTSAPPPSRLPPSTASKKSPFVRIDDPSSGLSGRRNDINSFTQGNQSYSFRGPEKGSNVPSMEESEDFATVKPQYPNERAEVFSQEEDIDANLRDAMGRAEAKFRHAKELRERDAKSARNRDYVPHERVATTAAESLDLDDRENQEELDRERLQREMEEKEKEQRRIEKERERELERERERARQAVERATREARERSAADARQKAERAAAEKARQQSERLAFQRASGEARERAANEAKERAEKSKAAAAREKVAAEAREKVVAEAREKAVAERAAAERATAEARKRAAERATVERVAAEARDRAAVEAREKAAAAAREKQNKAENDLEAFFSMGSRATSAPKQRDSFFDAQFQSKVTPETTRSTSSGSNLNMKNTSSVTNIVDDLSSIFGGEFPAVEGETEERRRARYERHQRTRERAAKALAEKNERDMQMQRDQAERHRMAETLDFEIRRWAVGKDGNLRALLSTLQYVLWPECGWQPVSLTDLIAAAAVKKVYRKATLCIHPDKVQQKGANLQQKYIAEKVFDLLKEAWNKFNSEELF